MGNGPRLSALAACFCREGTMKSDLEPGPGCYFAPAAWCSATKKWCDCGSRFRTFADAEGAARERGIYRVTVVCDGRRSDLEPFALVADR